MEANVKGWLVKENQMKFFLPTARDAKRIKKIPYLPRETIVISNQIDFDYKSLRFQCYYSQADGYWQTLNDAFPGVFLHEPFVWLADDIKPQKGWRKTAEAFYKEKYPKGLGLVALNDLHLKHGGAAFAITTRMWLYVLFGEAFFPGFGHNFLDTLAADRSKDLGRYFFCEDAVIEHLHYSIGKSEFDEVYEKNKQRAQNYQDKGKKDRYDREWINNERRNAKLRYAAIRSYE